MEMVSKQANTFLAGSVRDDLWRTVRADKEPMPPSAGAGRSK
jgi:hypothetical protein